MANGLCKLMTKLCLLQIFIVFIHYLMRIQIQVVTYALSGGVPGVH